MALIDIPHVVHAFHDVANQQPDGSGEQIVVVETDLQEALMQALRALPERT